MSELKLEAITQKEDDSIGYWLSLCEKVGYKDDLIMFDAISTNPHVRQAIVRSYKHDFNFLKYVICNDDDRDVCMEVACHLSTNIDESRDLIFSLDDPSIAAEEALKKLIYTITRTSTESRELFDAVQSSKMKFLVALNVDEDYLMDYVMENEVTTGKYNILYCITDTSFLNKLYDERGIVGNISFISYRGHEKLFKSAICAENYEENYVPIKVVLKIINECEVADDILLKLCDIQFKPCFKELAHKITRTCSLDFLKKAKKEAKKLKECGEDTYLYSEIVKAIQYLKKLYKKQKMI